jgi:hypothetical protein
VGASAQHFVDQVRLATDGKAPWAPTPLPAAPDFADWLADFRDAATAGKRLADLYFLERS